MKISRNTPDQLILDHIPWQSAIFSGLGICLVVFLGISYFPDEIFIGSVILAVGLAIGLFQFGLIVQRVQVIFDRAGGSVKIRQRGLFSYTQVTHDLSDIVARQERELSRLTHRVQMLMEREASREYDAGGSIPLADQKPPHW